MHDTIYSSAPERRSGKKDLMIRSLRMFSIINVAIVVVALQLIAVAQPSPYFYMGRQVNSGWDLLTLHYLFYLMLFGFIVGVSGIFVNTRRLKRKTDHLRLNLLVVTITSLVGIIAYLTI